MLKRILIALAVLVVGAAALIQSRPDHFAVERATVVAAPAARVFDQVQDLRAWEAWTPYRKLDPQQKLTLSNPSSGVGASVTWVGNERVGEGKLTIVEVAPNERVALEQEFFKPFAGKSRMIFSFAPESAGTKVTWRMEGHNDFLGKAMCLVMDMDGVLGPDMAEGLDRMKAVAQTPPEAAKAATP